MEDETWVLSNFRSAAEVGGGSLDHWRQFWVKADNSESLTEIRQVNLGFEELDSKSDNKIGFDLKIEKL